MKPIIQVAASQAIFRNPVKSRFKFKIVLMKSSIRINAVEKMEETKKNVFPLFTHIAGNSLIEEAAAVSH